MLEPNFEEADGLGISGRLFQNLCSSQNVQTLFLSVIEEGEKF